MDWFEKLTGFREAGYEETRNRLKVEGKRLISTVNGASYGIGKLELVSLQELRNRAKATDAKSGRVKVRVIRGDVRRLHQCPEYNGALFQVASQFNLLEMVEPNVTPEDGVTRYKDDHTQGPACAIAAGAATIYRNYFAPVGDQCGQTKERQLNGLADIGEALGVALNKPVADLWRMRNGYALCTQGGLEDISEHLARLTSDQIDALRAKLRIGVHWDVEVTEAPGKHKPIVSQAFCSALPIAYSQVPAQYWEPFAKLILESAYEATILTAAINASCGKSNVVLLTSLGGGAFGNRDQWIHSAMRRALRMVKGPDLNVMLVSYGQPSSALSQLAADCSR